MKVAAPTLKRIELVAKLLLALLARRCCCGAPAAGRAAQRLGRAARAAGAHRQPGGRGAADAPLL